MEHVRTVQQDKYQIIQIGTVDNRHLLEQLAKHNASKMKLEK